MELHAYCNHEESITYLCALQHKHLDQILLLHKDVTLAGSAGLQDLSIMNISAKNQNAGRGVRRNTEKGNFKLLEQWEVGSEVQLE